MLGLILLIDWSFQWKRPKCCCCLVDCLRVSAVPVFEYFQAHYNCHSSDLIADVNQLWKLVWCLIDTRLAQLSYSCHSRSAENNANASDLPQMANTAWFLAKRWIAGWGKIFLNPQNLTAAPLYCVWCVLHLCGANSFGFSALNLRSPACADFATSRAAAQQSDSPEIVVLSSSAFGPLLLPANSAQLFSNQNTFGTRDGLFPLHVKPIRSTIDDCAARYICSGQVDKRERALVGNHIWLRDSASFRVWSF